MASAMSRRLWDKRDSPYSTAGTYWWWAFCIAWELRWADWSVLSSRAPNRVAPGDEAYNRRRASARAAWFGELRGSSCSWYSSMLFTRGTETFSVYRERGILPSTTSE